MSRQSKEPTWPFLCILACLFVLSAAAPRAWERTVRTRDAVPVADADAASEAETVESAESNVSQVGAAADIATHDDLVDENELKVLLNTPMPHVRPLVDDSSVLLIVAPSPRIARLVSEATEVDFEVVEGRHAADRVELLSAGPSTTESFLSEETDGFSVVESEGTCDEGEGAIAAADLAPSDPEKSATVSADEVETTDDDVPVTVQGCERDGIAEEAPSMVVAEQPEMAGSEGPVTDSAEVSETTADEQRDSPPVAESVPETDDRDMSAVPGVSVLSSDDVSKLAAEEHVRRSRLDANADWLVPVSVFEQLEPLRWDCDTGEWSRDVADVVSRIPAELIADPVAAKESLEQLLVLGRAGVAMVKEIEGTDRFVEMRRALTMLHREVSVWDKIADAILVEPDQLKSIDWERVSGSIEQLRRVTSEAENGSAWHSFLELEKWGDLVSRAPDVLSDQERMAARIVLLKLQVKDVTEAQRTFLDTQEIRDFEEALTEIATEPVNAEELVRGLEAFERTGSQTAAEVIGLEHLKLSLSTLPAHRALAGRIAEAYTGPNVRIAVTGYLLNRMLPDRAPEYQWVRDTVLGTPVRGRSRISTEMGVALIPDTDRMRAALTIDGQVSASTSSTSGPATFFNDSESEYSAVKELEITPRGILFQPAEVTVDNRTRLRKIRTDFDGIPLLSSLVQSVARSQHDMNRPAIRREMNRKVQHKAETQIDEEVDARLGELNDRFKRRLLDPLAAMSLRPEVRQAETGVSRMSMQLELAGPTQLGSHTPRPWAPADSVLSFQIHQSALNNMLSGLELDGATLTIKELRERIAERFNRPELLEKSGEHDDVSITFAARDAARVDFQDGRVAVELGISRLRAGTRLWRDFRVRAYYRPETTRQSASLNRDGVVELIGRLRMGSQIALRGIFSKTFAKDQVITIVPEEMAADPRLRGLQVTQLTADDGWFGLAVGPERTQPSMASGSRSGTVK